MNFDRSLFELSRSANEFSKDDTQVSIKNRLHDKKIKDYTLTRFKFEDCMSGILHRINFFGRVDIIPYPSVDNSEIPERNENSEEKNKTNSNISLRISQKNSQGHERTGDCSPNITKVSFKNAQNTISEKSFKKDALDCLEEKSSRSNKPQVAGKKKKKHSRAKDLKNLGNFRNNFREGPECDACVRVHKHEWARSKS